VYVAGSAAGGLAWIGSKLIDKALRDDPVVFLRGFSAQGWLQSDGADDGDERNPAQDKRLSPREIRRLQRGGEDPEEIKGGVRTGDRDLFKDRKGNIYVKPKDGSGPGEPAGLNINDF